MATFTNRATLSYNGTVRTSNITTGELVEVLAITKTALAESYDLYDSVTYIVSITNSGTAAFNGLTLTDDLGGYDFGGNTVYPLAFTEGSVRVFVNGALVPAPTVTAGPPLSIPGINVPAGGNVIVVYEAETTEFAPPSAGSTITNTVTAAGDGLAAPITASETVTVTSGPNLIISKSLSPTVVSDNSRLTYTFVVQNLGNEDAVATDNVTITDTFNPILTDIVVTLNGAVLTEGTDYTYNEATGEFATAAGLITVPAAVFTQDPVSGEWVTDPGSAVLTVTGTI